MKAKSIDDQHWTKAVNVIVPLADVGLKMPGEQVPPSKLGDPDADLVVDAGPEVCVAAPAGVGWAAQSSVAIPAASSVRFSFMDYLPLRVRSGR